MKILLQICCAPCAIKCVESLREEGFDVTGLWYNPVIHPYIEWKKRRAALEKFSEKIDLPVIYRDDYNLEDNLRMLLEDPRFKVRCLRCYRDRLETAARECADGGFDAFTTTLLYSKYQMHDEIRRIADEAADQIGAEFLYRDFRPLWGRGITASKKMGLYRQRWCGCIFSEYEAERQRDNRE